MNPPLAVAPHFHLAAPWAERLLVADGDQWRPPQETELTALVSPPAAADLTDCVCLFSIPAHLRSSFWEMLARQASSGDGDFVNFAAEVARFLAFKELPAPAGAVFELVLRTAGGAFDGGGLWAVVNLGDAPAFASWTGLRLRLGPGEGCRVPGRAPPDVTPPPGEEPGVLLIIRCPS